MKKVLVLLFLAIFAFLCSGGSSLAEDFLGAPVMPGGKMVRADKSAFEKVYDLPKGQVVDYYKNILKEFKDIKFRDRSGRLCFDEYGNQPWQRITISQNPRGHTSVIIEKDSWTWILGTLTLRFIGVFAVLIVLYGAMAVATSLIIWAEKVPAKKPLLNKPAQAL